MKKKVPFLKENILAELISRSLFVGVIILFVYGGFAYYVSKKTFDSAMGDRLLAIARLTAGQTQPDWLPYLEGKGELYEKYRSFLRQKKLESQAKNIFLMDFDGRVLVDANGLYNFKEINWLRDLDTVPFQAALKGVPGTSILFRETDGGIYKIGYAPIYDKNNKITALLGVEASANFIEGLNQFAEILFYFGMLCLLLMGGLVYAFGRKFISPIKEMAAASLKIAEGDFSPRVKVTSSNELGALANAFNEMAKGLESHNEYILESMSNGLLVLDLKGHVTTFNRAACNILGKEQKNVLGLSYEGVFRDQPVFLNALKAAHQEHRHHVDHEITLSDESPKILRLRSAPLLGPDGQELGTEVLFNDETQLWKLRAEIKNSEKMATIGELAAGIAHEIRNPLGAMKGFAEILQKKLDSHPEAREMVTDIASEIEILNKIVTNFLTFAKPMNLEMQEADLTEVIKGLLPIVRKEAQQKKITIKFIPHGDIQARMDIEQFRRVVLNLALNAVQASFKGGEVSISTRKFSLLELRSYLEDQGLRDIVPKTTEVSWCCVCVEDDGPGIAPEHLQRLFTPFFTTKSEGFGLGLSITRKIMEPMGGSVAGNNKPEGGAVFLALLPAIEIMKEAES